ncbi:hypothetical protein HYY75_07760, partial [bacterium]|nr:hypothetical protein [bacterium]
MTFPQQNSKVSEKFKANISVGFGANFFTIGGVLLSLIILSKTNWVIGFYNQVISSLCLAPIFMGDAINSYWLCRIRMEGEKGWNDILVTPEGALGLKKLHLFWRALSMLPALVLALVFLTSLSENPTSFFFLKPVFLLFFILHFIRCFHSAYHYLAPLFPSLGGRGFVKKILIMGGIFSIWASWIFFRDPALPFSNLGFVFHGTFYFLFCGSLHPLPSKFSIFQLKPRGKPVIIKAIEPLPNELGKDFLLDETASEVKKWAIQGNFISSGFLKMPLLEMPIFVAVGEALIAPNNKTLLLILKSETQERWYRSVISWVSTPAES